MGLFSGEREQWELLGQNAILKKQKAFSQVEFKMRQTHRTLLFPVLTESQDVQVNHCH